jgi:mannose-6-phosphate isomerase-like protein (cupin superfamily)
MMPFKLPLASVEPIQSNHGEAVRELVGPSTNASYDYSMAVVEMAQNSGSQPHYHPEVEEVYFILQGTARMYLGDEHCQLNTGDTVVVKPGAWHHIQNISDEPLKILVTCTPAWTPEGCVYEKNAASVTA